jgi:hypothetical protein
MILSGFKEEIKQVQKIRSQNEVARWPHCRSLFSMTILGLDNAEFLRISGEITLSKIGIHPLWMIHVAVHCHPFNKFNRASFGMTMHLSIIWDLPKIFAAFQREQSHFCDGTIVRFSVASDFIADLMIAQTLWGTFRVPIQI